MEKKRDSSVYIDHRSRVKRTFLRGGLDSFEPQNALEMLLFYSVPQKDTKPMAHGLLERFGSFDKVLEADYESLLEVDGVGEHTAVYLKLLLESFRYYEKEKNRLGFRASSTSAAIAYAKSLFVGERRELCFLMCFDSRLQLAACPKVSEGSVNAADVSARRIVELATLHKAGSVILTHNHPGGNAIPSAEDMGTTKNIMRVLEPIGISLNDHIIVGARDCISMADAGILQNMKEEVRGTDGF